MPTSTYDMSVPDSRHRLNTKATDYLNDPSRRLKTFNPAPAGGAGLLHGSRYHGRETPLKGKGQPHPDGKLEGFAAAPGREPGAEGIRMVQEKWSNHSSTDVLNVKGAGAGGHEKDFKPSVRSFNSAFASSMQGTGSVVASQGQQAKRAVRRPGDEAPQDEIAMTQRRVIVDSVSPSAGLEKWEALRPSSVRNWEVPKRPINADSIIRHRYSDPNTEARCVKLDAGRTPAPTVAPPARDASRDAFFCAAAGYNANKGRGVYGSSFIFG